MIKKIVISICLWVAFFGQSIVAIACTPIPLKDYTTGKKYAYSFYQNPDMADNFRLNLSAENAFIVIAKANVKSTETKIQYNVFQPAVEYEDQTIRFKIKDVLMGDPRRIKQRQYPSDKIFQNAKAKTPILDFDFWDNIKLPERMTFNGSNLDSCGNGLKNIVIQDRQLYLLFGTQESKSTSIYHAVPILSPENELVQAFRKISQNAIDAPNKYPTQKYFSQMKGFADIRVLECPKPTDFRYEDSRFVGPEKQNERLYSIRESFNHKPIEFRDVMAYSGNLHALNFECTKDDRYLALSSRYPKFLKIENGMIDVGDISTNIDIEGDRMIPVADIKTWIKAAQSK